MAGLHEEISIEIPVDFACPITGEVMVDPVMAVDGHSYERCAIERWFSLGHCTSPKTNTVLRSHELVPNHTLRGAIVDLMESMPQLQRDRTEMRVWTKTLDEICEGIEQKWHRRRASPLGDMSTVLPNSQQALAGYADLEASAAASAPRLGTQPSGSGTARAGWLAKRSRYIRQWRQRWVVLSPSALQTFKNSTCSAPTENLQLHRVLAANTSIRQGTAHNAIVHVRLAFRREVLLSADSPCEAEVWASAIHLAAAEARRCAGAVMALQAARDSSQLTVAIQEARAAGVDEELLSTKAATLADLQRVEEMRQCAAEVQRCTEEAEQRRLADEQRRVREEEERRKRDEEDSRRSFEEPWRRQRLLAEEEGRRRAEEVIQRQPLLPFRDDSAAEWVRAFRVDTEEEEVENKESSCGSGLGEQDDSGSVQSSSASSGSGQPMRIRILESRYRCCAGEILSVEGESRDGQSLLIEGRRQIPKSLEGLGWEWFSDDEAGDDDETTLCYRAFGAGDHRVNGLYVPTRDSNDGVTQYQGGEGDNVTLLRYRFPQTGRAFWFFSMRDPDGKASCDIDLYRTEPSEAVEPPLGQVWLTSAAIKPRTTGSEPAPKLRTVAHRRRYGARLF